MSRAKHLGVHGWALVGMGLAIVVMVAACSMSTEGQHKTKLKNTGEPKLHAIHNDHLRKVMADLDTLAAKGHCDSPCALEEKHSECLERAQKLAESAGDVSKLMVKLELDGACREAYLCNAGELLKHALQYRESCQEKQLDEMRRSLESMVTTCNACHDSFRKM